MQLRYETCMVCGKSWNVSRELQVPKSGYICPHCQSKLLRG